MRVALRGTSWAKRSSSRLNGTRARPQEMALREDQLFAKVDQRKLAPVVQHGLDGCGIERACGGFGHGFLEQRCRQRIWPARACARAGHDVTTLGCLRLRRLLRRHLLHVAGLQVDADAVDHVEVGAGDAHEARLVRIIDRVDRAVLVDAGLAGIEAVLLLRLELGVWSGPCRRPGASIRSCRSTAWPGRRSPRTRRDRAAARRAPCR